MSRDNRSHLATAFTLSIEAREGVTTGISASDRARTIQVAIADEAKAEDIVVPGHVFPLRARDGGVLVRAGHSEASVDLANLAGPGPAAVICEIMKSDGTMARLPDLIEFAKLHGLLLSSIAELISYREARESLVQLVAETALVHQGVALRAYAYRSTIAGDHHLALVSGSRLGPGNEVQDPVLVRVQKEAVLSDVFQLPGTAPAQACMRQILEAENGCLLYMRDDLRPGPSRQPGADGRARPPPDARPGARPWIHASTASGPRSCTIWGAAHAPDHQRRPPHHRALRPWAGADRTGAAARLIPGSGLSSWRAARSKLSGACRLSRQR